MHTAASALTRACVRAGVRGLQAYLERCKALAERMNGRDLATLLHAFAVMRVRPGRKTLDALGFRAVQVLQEGGMQPQVGVGV